MHQSETVFQRKIPQVHYLTIARAKTRGMWQWDCTFEKLFAARLTRYERVAIIDADVYIYRNLDHLFEIDPGNSVVAPIAYWLPQPFFMSGGPLLIKTNKTAFVEVIEKKHGKKFGGEMDYLNEKFAKTAFFLNSSYTVLLSDWFQKNRNKTLELLSYREYVKPFLVHFIADLKPPLPPQKIEKMTPEGKNIYRDYMLAYNSG